jgi:hypothetical protein
MAEILVFVFLFFIKVNEYFLWVNIFHFIISLKIIKVTGVTVSMVVSALGWPLWGSSVRFLVFYFWFFELIFNKHNK